MLQDMDFRDQVRFSSLCSKLRQTTKQIFFRVIKAGIMIKMTLKLGLVIFEQQDMEKNRSSRLMIFQVNDLYQAPWRKGEKYQGVPAGQCRMV